MPEPTWIDGQGEPAEREPMLDWAPPAGPTTPRAVSKKRPPTPTGPRQKVAKGIGWFILRFLAGIGVMLAVVVLWLFVAARLLPASAALPALTLMIVATFIVAAVLSVQLRWHGLVSGVLATLIAIVASIIGVVFLILRQCGHGW